MNSDDEDFSTSSEQNGSSSEEASQPYRRRLPFDVDVKWHNSQRKGRKIEYECKLYRYNAPSKQMDDENLALYNFYICYQEGCTGRLWIVRATSKVRFEIGEHTCEDQLWRVSNADVRDKQDALMKANIDMPGSLVVERSLEGLNDVQKMHTPRRNSMIERANRRMRKELNLPAEPKDFRFEAIPDSLKNFGDGILDLDGILHTPLFAYSTADMYTPTIEKRARDNNTMESNNKKLKRLLGNKPGEWWMARHLREAYDSDYRLQYLQFVAGHVEPRKAKSIRANKRIFAQVQQFTQVIAGRKPVIEWADGMVAAF